MVEISVIVPIFNEEEILSQLYERLSTSIKKITTNYEIIFVNDGSIDTSILKIKDISEKDDCVFFINFSKNFGHQIAVSAGLKFANGAATVIIDGDLQDPPELIPELYAKLKEGYNVVYAKRRKRKGETAFKLITAKVFYRILKRITTTEIPVDTGDFRIIDRKVLDAVNSMPEQNKFLRGQIAWVGFKQTFVEYDRDSRKTGETGYSIGQMFKFAMDGITGFSDTPLLFVSRMGIIMSGVSFLIILYALFSHFFLQITITGWTSVIVSTMFFGGIQLISIGIIGEYISRMNKNILNRPLYIIEDTNCKPKSL